MSRHCTITAAHIAIARSRVAAGESQSAVARDLGVKRDSLGYHLRGGKSARYVKSPWTPHTRAAFRAIGTGNHAEAAHHFTAAAKALLDL